MEKEIFYAPSLNRDSLGNPLQIYEIPTEDIRHLVLYIIENVKPLPMSVTITEGYISALTQYTINNPNEEFPYKETFEKLKYGANSEFLYKNVNLALLENEFRQNGINQKQTEIYNKLIESYRKQLEYNCEVYGQSNIVEKNNIPKR